LFYTDEDISEEANPKGGTLVRRRLAKVPEGDRIVNYEVISPPSEAERLSFHLLGSC
jgi:hypothetical protein